MWTNKDTRLFCSVSSHPGNFGCSLYNAAFDHLGYNAIYKPLKCDTISQFVDIVRYAQSYSISGMSVSMPFKKVAINLGTYGDDDARDTGNANTLFWYQLPSPACYNTDSVGFERANIDILKQASFATIIGKGAVSDSVQYVLEKYSILSVRFSSREKLKHPLAMNDFDWLINCSPIGMDHVSDGLFTEKFIKPFKYVSDVVLNKETNLIKIAKKLGKPHVNGVSMSLEQLCAQFRLYTHLEAPRSVFQEVLKGNGYV